MSFLDRVAALAPPDFSGYLDFRVDGARVGRVKRDFARRLEAFPEVFRVAAMSVDLAPGLVGVEARSAAVDGVLRRLADDGLIPGWRDEAYPVGPSFAAPNFSRWNAPPCPCSGCAPTGST